MHKRPRNRVARDLAERFITRRLVRQLMIEYEYVSGWSTAHGAGCSGTKAQSAEATSAAITAVRRCARSALEFLL
jgi:hypothetical protein